MTASISDRGLKHLLTKILMAAAQLKSQSTCDDSFRLP